jgi:hypothetical protein
MATPLLVLATLTGMGYALSKKEDVYMSSSSRPDRTACLGQTRLLFPTNLLASSRAAEARGLLLTRGPAITGYSGLVYSELRGETVSIETWSIGPQCSRFPPGSRNARRFCRCDG